MKGDRNNHYNGEKYGRYGDELRRCLKKLKKRQKHLAQAIGLSEGSVSAYCNGTRLPERDVQEKILRFISDYTLCNALQFHYDYFLAEADLVDGAFEFGSNILEGINTLAQRGHVRQAISQAKEFLITSIDHTLREELQVALFELLMIQGRYATGHELAVAVGNDDLQRKEVRLFRSLAMRGIASRALASKGSAISFRLLQEAFEMASQAPTLIDESHHTIVERMHGLQVIERAQHSDVRLIKAVLSTFNTRLKKSEAPLDRANTLEAIIRCYIKIQDYSEAQTMLGEIAEVELRSVLTLEERLLIIRARLLELTGELQEAAACYLTASELCSRKGNLHHQQFAEFGLIRVREQLLKAS